MDTGTGGVASVGVNLKLAWPWDGGGTMAAGKLNMVDDVNVKGLAQGKL